MTDATVIGDAGRDDADWPAPVEVVNEAGASPVVLLCEHASHHVPQDYARLGLAQADLERHIGWDIGAAEVTRNLARLIDAPAFLGTYSRLLVDLNRPPGVASSMPELSEVTPIPGNCDLPQPEIARRLDRIFRPYHRQVAAHLDARAAAGRASVLVTIHSFTPVYMGVARPWHCGILYSHSRCLGERLIDRLRREAGLVVGANVPYEISADGDYAVPVHGEARGLDAVLVEIRHDLIREGSGARLWAERLAAALAATEEAGR